MSKQIVMWTALPNGIVGEAPNRRLRLSVFVSPRLQADGEEGPLSLFPDFLDWPAHLQPGQSFALQVEGRQFPATITSPPPDSSLWTALFAASAVVRSHQLDDLTRRPVSSYPAASLHDHIKKSYQKICATSPMHLADHAALETAFPDLHRAFRATGGPPAPQTSETQALTIQRIQASQNNLAQSLFGQIDLTRNIASAVANARQLAQFSDPAVFTEVLPNTGTPTSHFAQLAVFHHRPLETAPPSRSTPPPMDFHQAVAALGEYPELLRRLGLVIDLELPEGGFPQSPSGQSAARLLQIIPTFTTPLFGTNYSPFTAYILEGDRFFLPAPSPPPPAGAGSEAIFGLLDLQKPGLFDVIQVDVDGAALKAIHMVAGQINGTPQPDGGENAPTQAGVPALRTSGVWITHTDHARILHGRFNTALANNALLESNPPQPATFFAEDLIRGYRVDVFDSRSGQWHSLHQRRGNYTFKNHAGGPLTLSIADEGAAQPAATQPPGVPGTLPDPHSELYVHESLFHWQGWSLAAPRPGKTIMNTGPGIVKNEAPSDGFPLEVAFTAAPASLPRLRFGVQYQFRARTVDLAGNSLALNDANALLDFLPLLGRLAPVLPANLPDFTYRRFEPVISPVLVPRENFMEGESQECLVIRSNRVAALDGLHDQSTAAYATQLTARVAAARPAAKAIYSGVNERHVAPPKASLWMAETLGRLDDSFGTRPTETPEEFAQRCARTYNLARKEKGRLNDTAIIDIATGTPIPIPATTGVDPQTGATIARPSVEFIVTNQDSKADHGYAIHHEPQLRLPYLPDPLAHGAALFGLPGVPSGQAAQLNVHGNLVFAPSTLPPETIAGLGSITQIVFGPGDAWPERQPFRLQLVEPAGPTALLAWDPTTRVLTVPLAKAEQATIRLSSFLNQEDLDKLGIWKWMIDWNADQGLPPPAAGTVQTALAGAFWMLTPFREITLVHAVQQPLTEPKVLFLEPLPDEIFTASDRGRTFALLMGEIQVHGDSTMKLDLLARWDEPIDRVEEVKPSTVTAHAHVCELPIHLPGQPPIESEAVNIPNPPPSPEQLLRFLLAAKPGVRFAAAKQAVQFGGTRHEFGDTKHRRVRYQAIGTTRFREYFPPEVTQDANNLSRSSEEVEVHILSTTRPAAPKLLYVLPTFGWQKPDDSSAGVKVRKRLGGGLRVYLDRPWFSSGEGELLGVILATDPSSPPNELLQPYVTHWGRDPVWQSNPTLNPPSASNFKKAVEPASGTSGLSLEEVGGPSRVTVVGHAVNFDEKRQLWYCDIEIKGKDVGESYFPFVRLALARYQPHSVENAHLSRVVVADFAQLAPDRTVIVRPVQGDPDRFTITVEGLTYRSNAWHPGDASGETVYEVPRIPVLPRRDGTVIEANALRDASGDPVEINPAPKLVRVSVQKRIPGTTDDAGWQSDPSIRPTATSAVQAGSQPDPATPLWSGQVILPTDRRPGQFRVVIQEFEHFLTDDSFDRLRIEVPVPPDEALQGQPRIVFLRKTFFPGEGRLVFADTIEL